MLNLYKGTSRKALVFFFPLPVHLHSPRRPLIVAFTYLFTSSFSFSVSVISSWFDPPKAKEAAFAMIDKGADVMYAERFGVSDAAKERKVLAIGNVINTQKDYPDTVVVSAIWNMEPSVNSALAAVKAGKFKAEDYGHLSFMKAKGSELSPLGAFEKKVPAALVTKVKAKEKAILDGSFKVVIDETVPKGK